MKKEKKRPVFTRLIKYMLKTYPLQYVVIAITLLISNTVSISNTIFSSILINSIVEPFQMGSILQDEAFLKLMYLGISMALLYLTGVACNLIYQRTIAITSQKFSMI